MFSKTDKHAETETLLDHVAAALTPSREDWQRYRHLLESGTPADGSELRALCERLRIDGPELLLHRLAIEEAARLELILPQREAGQAIFDEWGAERVKWQAEKHAMYMRMQAKNDELEAKFSRGRALHSTGTSAIDALDALTAFLPELFGRPDDFKPSGDFSFMPVKVANFLNEREKKNKIARK